MAEVTVAKTQSINIIPHNDCLCPPIPPISKTPTRTPTPTPTYSVTPTPSITPSDTPNVTPTRSLTPTPTSSSTSTPTPSVTPTNTPAFPPECTPPISQTPTLTRTPTRTPVASSTPASTRPICSPTPSETKKIPLNCCNWDGKLKVFYSITCANGGPVWRNLDIQLQKLSNYEWIFNQIVECNEILNLSVTCNANIVFNGSDLSCRNKWNIVVNKWPCHNAPFTTTMITSTNINNFNLPQTMKDEIINSAWWPKACDCDIPYAFVLNGTFDAENCSCCDPPPTPTETEPPPTPPPMPSPTPPPPTPNNCCEWDGMGYIFYYIDCFDCKTIWRNFNVQYNKLSNYQWRFNDIVECDEELDISISCNPNIGLNSSDLSCKNKWNVTVSKWPCYNAPFSTTMITSSNINTLNLPQSIIDQITSSPWWPKACDCNIPYAFILNGQFDYDNCGCCCPCKKILSLSDYYGFYVSDTGDTSLVQSGAPHGATGSKIPYPSCEGYIKFEIFTGSVPDRVYAYDADTGTLLYDSGCILHGNSTPSQPVSGWTVEFGSYMFLKPEGVTNVDVVVNPDICSSSPSSASIRVSNCLVCPC